MCSQPGRILRPAGPSVRVAVPAPGPGPPLRRSGRRGPACPPPCPPRSPGIPRGALLGDQLVEHQLAREVQLDHERDVVVGTGRPVAATEQPPVDVGQRVHVDGHLGALGRDADGQRVAAPVEDVEGVAQHGRVPDAVERPVDAAGPAEGTGHRAGPGGTISRMAATASVSRRRRSGWHRTGGPGPPWRRGCRRR